MLMMLCMKVERSTQTSASLSCKDGYQEIGTGTPATVTFKCEEKCGDTDCEKDCIGQDLCKATVVGGSIQCCQAGSVTDGGKGCCENCEIPDINTENNQCCPATTAKKEETKVTTPVFYVNEAGEAAGCCEAGKWHGKCKNIHNDVEGCKKTCPGHPHFANEKCVALCETQEKYLCCNEQAELDLENCKCELPTDDCPCPCGQVPEDYDYGHSSGDVDNYIGDALAPTTHPKQGCEYVIPGYYSSGEDNEATECNNGVETGMICPSYGMCAPSYCAYGMVSFRSNEGGYYCCEDGAVSADDGTEDNENFDTCYTTSTGQKGKTWQSEPAFTFAPAAPDEKKRDSDIKAITIMAENWQCKKKYACCRARPNNYVPTDNPRGKSKYNGPYMCTLNADPSRTLEEEEQDKISGHALRG